VGTSAEELALMRRIDVIHLKWPFYGARKLCEVLRAEGTSVNRKRMQRIMRVMGLESVPPKLGSVRSRATIAERDRCS
jgi:putative transposase